MPAAPPPDLDQFACTHPLRVRWSEVDAQGVVFNAHYLLYFDIVMTEYMRGVGGLELSAAFFVVHTSLDFRGPARFDDELTLAARVARLGRTSFTMRLAVFRGREALVDGTSVYVHAVGAPPAPVPLPPSFRDRVLAREPTPPSDA